MLGLSSSTSAHCIFDNLFVLFMHVTRCGFRSCFFFFASFIHVSGFFFFAFFKILGVVK